MSNLIQEKEPGGGWVWSQENVYQLKNKIGRFTTVPLYPLSF